MLETVKREQEPLHRELMNSQAGSLVIDYLINATNGEYRLTFN